MNKIIVKIIIGLLLVFSSLLIGYICGSRSKVESEKIVEIKWIKGKEIRDTIRVLEPYEVLVPDSIPVFISTIDTTELLAVYKDYHNQKKYDLDFSDDSIGVFKVDAVVNQNKLVSATSIIQPNIRTVYEKEVVNKVSIFKPWLSVGTSIDLKTNKVQLGVDLKRYMFGISGIRVNNKYSYTIDFGIKF